MWPSILVFVFEAGDVSLLMIPVEVWEVAASICIDILIDVDLKSP